MLAAVCGAAWADTPEPAGDVLQFIDGSSLHGQLDSVRAPQGIAWSSPAAEGPMRFLPNQIDLIRFSHARTMSLTPSCHLSFANGDDLFGSISRLDSDHLDFHTWFGGTMSIPRASLRAITFLSKNYSIVYEGPYDSSGWVIGNNSAQGWNFRDGAFIANGPGTLARDFSLTNSTTIEFDLSWSGLAQLLVDVYSDALDHLEYNGGSYVFEFTPRQINFRHVQNGGIPQNYSAVPLPELTRREKMHVTIQCNREDSSVTVFINNVLARKWKDESKFHSTGTGLLFHAENVAGATIKLSNLKVSQWEGAYEPDTSIGGANSDGVHFVNHDRAGGKIVGIADGKVRLALAGRVLEIPLARVTQLNFAGTNVLSEPSGPWVVRAHFPGGGSISFHLEKWDDKTVFGTSALFGTLAFQPGAIREMEFNLDHPKNNGPTVTGEDFEDLDE